MFLLDADIFFQDLALLLVLVFTFSLAIACSAWIKRNRKKYIRRGVAFTIGTASVAIFVAIAYGMFVEPNILTVSQHTVPFPTKESLKIIVLGDYHIGSYKNHVFVERSVQETNRLLPDIVLLTGDFILGDRADLDELLPLKKLHANLGVYAVMGNHDIGQLQPFGTKWKTKRTDRSDEIESFLEGIGITVLRNENQILSLGDEKISVAGIDDLWGASSHLAAALQDIDEDVPVLLLSHNPSIAQEISDQKIRLVVSGHTHNGQVRLPGLPPLTRLPTTIGQNFDAGVFTINSTAHLAITRGLGESHARMRLFSWPEILVLNTVSSL